MENQHEPPGTSRIYNESNSAVIETEFVVQPTPSDDPNDPLNWSMIKKMFNLFLTLIATAIIFTAISVQPTYWQLMVLDMPIDYDQLIDSAAINYVGCAVGCNLFIPFATKYGRRSIYVLSSLIMVLLSIWSAKMSTAAELYMTNLLWGLSGATNETLVQMTIADIFFTHQRGTANGFYMAMVLVGSFLSPIPAGYIGDQYGWRLSYWIMTAFLGVQFLSLLFLYEETKYIPTLEGILDFSPAQGQEFNKSPGPDENMKRSENQPTVTLESRANESSISRTSYRNRMRFITKTDESLWRLFCDPFIILFRFPAVMFTAVQYAFGLGWVTIQMLTISALMPYPPYNLDAFGIGLMSLGPFIGCVIGAVYGGYLTDHVILWLARRNHGVYEPEMRLHMVHLPVIVGLSGFLMFGICFSQGMHWIYLQVGGALFGFSLGSYGDIALCLVIDSYRGVTGEAFVGITFVRNIVSIILSFAVSPWLQAQGLQNMYITCSVWYFVIAVLYIPMMIYGKRIRRKTEDKYKRLVGEKGAHGRI